MKDIQERRRRNLEAVRMSRRENQAEFAKKLGVSAGYLSQLKNEHTPFHEDTARKFEKKLRLQPGSLDTEEDGPLAAHTPKQSDRDLRMGVAQAVEAALGDKELSARKYGKLVVFAFEDAKLIGHVIDGHIQHLVTLVIED